MKILVSNDDGYLATGINVLSEALESVADVVVVAPDRNRSAASNSLTVHNPLRVTEYAPNRYRVDGTPSDCVHLALTGFLDFEPDLVVSGINEGQNLGPLVDISGTVGAARAAARRGVPALAVSQGLGEEPDFDAAAELAVEWTTENLDAVRAGDLGADVVYSLNVPTCTEGELRGEVEVESGTEGNPLAESDCTSTAEGQTDDVSAFADGFATLTEVPLEPAA